MGAFSRPATPSFIRAIIAPPETDSLFTKHFGWASVDATGRLQVATATEAASTAQLVTSAGAPINSAFVAPACTLKGVFGYNVHPTIAYYVQLWEGNGPVTPNALTSLRGVIPIQPANGIFSLDIPMPFPKGFSVAISSSQTAFVSVGNQLVFTALVRLG